MILEKTIVRKKLLKNINLIKNIKTLENYTNKIKVKKYSNSKKIPKSTIKYIITIKYFRTSTSLTASEINGKTFFICISKLNQARKNRKINKKSNLKILIKTLIKNCPFILTKPISLHLINVGYDKTLILKSLSQFFILMVKIFNINAHNGCRPSKKRRIKQRTKKFFNFYKPTKKKLFLEAIRKKL